MSRRWLIPAVVLAALCSAEFLAWRASMAYTSAWKPDAEYAARTIVVLGCRCAVDGSTTRTQRYRVRIALRSYRAGDHVVFSGGVTHGRPRSEAAVMAECAVSGGLPADSVTLEELSQTTW